MHVQARQRQKKKSKRNASWRHVSSGMSASPVQKRWNARSNILGSWQSNRYMPIIGWLPYWLPGCLEHADADADAVLVTRVLSCEIAIAGVVGCARHVPECDISGYGRW